MTIDEKMYEIACSIPTLRRKNVEGGKIPGIGRDRFDAIELAEYLYRRWTDALSDEEILIFEFLLNTYNPYIYEEFNMGKALNLLNARDLNAMLSTLSRIGKKQSLPPSETE